MKEKFNNNIKNIKYFSYYVHDDGYQKRYCDPASKNKIAYICQVLNYLGYNVEIISASCTKDQKNAYKGFYKKINDMQRLHMFFTFPWGNIIQKILGYISIRFFLFMELMKVKKNEKVIVYHSLGYMRLVELAHRIRKYYLILEVEEIYSDVSGNSKLKVKEISFMKSADSYIFSTESLNKLVNKDKKAYVVSYGAYTVEEDRGCRFKEILSNEEYEKVIHCVYAGNFDPRKGGGIAAVEAAAFLPANYHVHILGFGNESDTKKLKDIMTSLVEKYKCKVTLDGCLSGEEYIRFIQSCDIGLNTQNPNADFNATSFPSKILSYMSNGLHVVSVRIPVVELSEIGDYMYFYNEQKPEEIAKAILKIDINEPYNSREIIRNLDNNLKVEMGELLS